MTKFGTHAIVAIVALGLGVGLAGSLGAFASRAPVDRAGHAPFAGDLDDPLADGMERPVLPERHFDLDSDLPGVEAGDRPDWKPLTATFTWSGGRGPVSAATLARRDDRVSIRYEGCRQEWFFMRNPVNAGYFSGVLVDHDNARRLVFHHADLRFEGLARTWEGAGNLGLDRRTLDALERTGETREAFGLVFERLRRPDAAPDLLVAEVWWNEDLRLPLRVVTTAENGTWVQELTALERAVDETRLERPAMRYPRYVPVDLGDSCDLCGVAHGCGTDHEEDSRPTRIVRTPLTEKEEEPEAPEAHDCGADHTCGDAQDHDAGEPAR